MFNLDIQRLGRQSGPKYRPTLVRDNVNNHQSGYARSSIRYIFQIPSHTPRVTTQHQVSKYSVSHMLTVNFDTRIHRNEVINLGLYVRERDMLTMILANEVLYPGYCCVV